MIIQCEKCQTRFKLDDSRITEKGVKVRCTKCKHVFRVQRDGLGAVSTQEDTAAESFTPAAAPPDNSFASPETQNFTTESVAASPFETATAADTSFTSDCADFSSFAASSSDSAAISFESDEPNTVAANNDLVAERKPAAVAGEVDFSGFDFGDSAAEPDSVSPSTLTADAFTEIPSEPALTEAHKETPQGLDFSDDDIFGAVAPSAPEASGKPITFDFDDDSFAESMLAGGQDQAGKSGASIALETPGETPFNLGEIDFGDELTSVVVQQVNPDDLKPSQEVLFAPLAKAQDKLTADNAPRVLPDENTAAAHQELPPLSIASRRKQSAVSAGLIAVVAIVLAAVIGYYGYTSLSASKEAGVHDAGKISVRSVTARFVANTKAGELLVIAGETVNEFPTPRASLQVKVTVFDKEGQSITTKTAYGGNPLSDEQLKDLPLDKLETAMANQFGDSLANMEVAPGKAVPFVVVLANLPKGAKDFGVQSAGSTVATGKQQ